MVNVKGQHFDVLQRGYHTFLQIPRGAAPGDTMLRVEALIMGGSSCEFAFIQSINITGKWAEQNGTRPGGFKFEALPMGVHIKRRRHSWTLGPVIVHIGYGLTASDFPYLNFHVKKLNEAGMSVGGLLGEDDHTAAASLNNCDQDSFRSNVSYADQVEAGSSAATVS